MDFEAFCQWTTDNKLALPLRTQAQRAIGVQSPHEDAKAGVPDFRAFRDTLGIELRERLATGLRASRDGLDGLKRKLGGSSGRDHGPPLPTATAANWDGSMRGLWQTVSDMDGNPDSPERQARAVCVFQDKFQKLRDNFRSDDGRLAALQRDVAASVAPLYALAKEIGAIDSLPVPDGQDPEEVDAFVQRLMATARSHALAASSMAQLERLQHLQAGVHAIDPTLHAWLRIAWQQSLRAYPLHDQPDLGDWPREAFLRIFAARKGGMARLFQDSSRAQEWLSAHSDGQETEPVARTLNGLMAVCVSLVRWEAGQRTSQPLLSIELVKCILQHGSEHRAIPASPRMLGALAAEFPQSEDSMFRFAEFRNIAEDGAAPSAAAQRNSRSPWAIHTKGQSVPERDLDGLRALVAALWSDAAYAPHTRLALALMTHAAQGLPAPGETEPMNLRFTSKAALQPAVKVFAMTVCCHVRDLAWPPSRDIVWGAIPLLGFVEQVFAVNTTGREFRSKSYGDSPGNCMYGSDFRDGISARSQETNASLTPLAIALLCQPFDSRDTSRGKAVSCMLKHLRQNVPAYRATVWLPIHKRPGPDCDTTLFVAGTPRHTGSVP